MARYLIVAHQTAESEELRAAARALADREPEAEFSLLVPATPVSSLLLWEEGEATQVAEGRAASAQEQLLADGVRVVEARVGDGEPYNAVADELRRRPDYEGILVGTLPPGVSRWLRIDLISRLRRLAPGREILHVIVTEAAHKRVAQ
jgi:hypothetical protein